MTDSNNADGGAASVTVPANQPAAAPDQQPDQPTGPQQRVSDSGASLLPNSDGDVMRAEYQRAKEEVARNPNDVQAKKHFRQLNEFRFNNGPVPEALRSKLELDPNQAHDTVADGAVGAYQMPSSPADYHATGTLHPEVTSWAKDVAHALGLPADSFKTFEQVIANHSQGGAPEMIDDSNRQEYQDALLELYGGDHEKMATQVGKANAFLEAKLGRQGMAQFEAGIGGTSLAWDPKLINKLAAMFDAYGGKVIE